MNVSTTGIENMIASYTQGLDAKRQELHLTALGEINVRNTAFHVEQLTTEVTRLQGVIQGLTSALVDIQAQQQGFGSYEIVDAGAVNDGVVEPV